MQSILNLNKVHTLGQIGNVIGIAFYEFKFLYFSACQSKYDNEAHLIVVVIYRDVISYWIRENRKIGPVMILGM